ncbi:hypothetical protein G6F62_015806 [Rhizopus arrhizus]|nr:hypothetical protein G6F35_018579 [Rhizopus arrhizus]KAG1303425.1 hypothetical protein G6F62_015806 [Rhizopus arrhizus]
MAGRRIPYFLTGLPSASITVTSPRFSARTAASVCLRSPTTTQVSACGLISAAACCTCAGVIASISALRRST